MNAESTQSRPFPPEFVAYHHRGAPLEGFVSSTQIGYFPELLAFGSDGAGEMLAFNRLNQVLMVPFIGMDMEDAILLAASWSDFERILNLQGVDQSEVRVPENRNERSRIELEPSGHPLAQESRDGITYERLLEIYAAYGHRIADGGRA